MSQQSAFMGFVHRRRRGAELFLLLLALIVGIGAYAAVGLGVDGEVPANLVGYGGWLVALVIATHVVVRIVAPYADPVLLPIVAALNGLGLAVIYRLDPDLANQQLIWMTLAVAAFVATLVVISDHRILARFTYTSGLAAVVLLLMPLMPLIGAERINGARIWVNLGPIGFQPGEVAKVLLAITFAGYLAVHRDALALAGRRLLFIDFPRGRDLGPVVMVWIISLGVLVFQRDLGVSLLFLGMFLVMLYVATERPGWLVVGGLLFVVGAICAFLFFGHARRRFDIWVDPFDDQHGAGYQLVEGLYGFAWGGLIGRGFGEGMPNRVPEVETDFIVAAIGEELGLTAVLAIILMYGLIVERALRAALICRDGFGKLLATGLASVFALQVFVVIGGISRLIPLTGLTTPFLSYGGSSLLMNWVIIALLLRISDQARRPLPEQLGETEPEPDEMQTQMIKIKGGEQ
jgi:cell division protein FtsW (lipid II flippase)